MARFQNKTRTNAQPPLACRIGEDFQNRMRLVVGDAQFKGGYGIPKARRARATDSALRPSRLAGDGAGRLITLIAAPGHFPSRAPVMIGYFNTVYDKLF